VKQIIKRLWKDSQHLVLAGVACANAITMCWIFFNIRVKGIYYFSEHNSSLLNAELSLCIVGAVFAILMFLKYWIKIIKRQL
jgi:hypothetical protein